MVRNSSDYQNCDDAVSPDDLPPPPTAMLARNHVEQASNRPVAVAVSQRKTNPPSLPTSPVHVPAGIPATNLSSPTDSYDSNALGKVCMLFCCEHKFENIDLHTYVDCFHLDSFPPSVSRENH